VKKGRKRLPDTCTDGQAARPTPQSPARGPGSASPISSSTCCEWSGSSIRARRP